VEVAFRRSKLDIQVTGNMLYISDDMKLGVTATKRIYYFIDSDQTANENNGFTITA
jgi:hypothetical protein